MSEDFIDSKWEELTIQTHNRYYGIFLTVQMEYKLHDPDDDIPFSLRNIFTNGEKVHANDLTRHNLWNIKNIIFKGLTENDKKFLKQFERKKLFGIF